jgi:hypothetical protein
MEHQQIRVLLIHPEEEGMDSKKEWRGMRGNVSLAILSSRCPLHLADCFPGEWLIYSM